MRLFLFACLICLFSMLCACVKPKVYRAELAARSAAEAREKVLVKELYDRKTETATLTRQVAELNRTVGNQEHQIKDLQTELSNRTQMLGASSSKLANEKADLERELALKKEQLGKYEALLQSIRNVLSHRKMVLHEIDSTLAYAYVSYAEAGASVSQSQESVVLTLPDKILFENNGLLVSVSGTKMLKPLADLLAARPDLDVEVIAYTDNILPPREKNLKDTWEWSLQRATNVTRLLIREFNTNANQLTPVGRGEFYPVTSNETPEGRQKNRRTVIVVHPPVQQLPDID